MKGRLHDWAPAFALSLGLRIALCACGFAAACAAGTPRAEEAREETELRLRGPLLAHVPHGARYVGRLEPARLWSEPAVRRTVQPLIRPGGLEAFENRTGVPLLEIEEAVFARFGERGFLWLLRLPERVPAADVVVANAQRMAPVEVSSDAPFVRRVGVFGSGRRELVAVAPRVLLVSGEAGPAVAELLAAVRRGDAAFGLEGPGRELAGEWARAPALLLSPAPLPLDRSQGIGLVLARHEAAALRVDPEPDALSLRVAIRGELPPGAEANFRTWMHAMAASDLGRTLGLEAALPSYRAALDEAGAELRVVVPAEGLAAGLRLLFTAELREIFGA